MGADIEHSRLEKMIKDLADERHKVERKWYEWRMGVDDKLLKNESAIISLAENLNRVSYVTVVNGKTEIKPIQIAIGEIWEATALFRTINKVIQLINRRPLTRKLFKFANMIFVSAILYAVFGYAIFGVPFIKLIEKFIN